METPPQRPLDLATEKLQGDQRGSREGHGNVSEIGSRPRSNPWTKMRPARRGCCSESKSVTSPRRSTGVLRGGGVLQEVEAPSGDDFSEFVPRVVDVAAAAQAAGEDAVAAVRSASGHLRARTHRSARRPGGVAELEDPQEKWGRLQAVAGRCAAHGGLTSKAHGWVSGRSFAHHRRQIRDDPGGCEPGGPLLCSPVRQSGSRRVRHHAGVGSGQPVSADGLHRRGHRNQANIIVYFGTLSLADRRHLRTLTRTTAGGKASPIVIDEAVIGWLSHLTEPGWRFTQRITLLFTGAVT